MKLNGLTLLLPAKTDVERDQVAQAWQDANGEILRLDRFWEPPALERQAVRLYGPMTSVEILAQLLGLHLAIDLIHLPRKVAGVVRNGRLFDARRMGRHLRVLT